MLTVMAPSVDPSCCLKCLPATDYKSLKHNDKVLKSTFTETQLLRSRAPHTEVGAFVRVKEGKGGRSRGGGGTGCICSLANGWRRFTHV